MAGAAVQGSRGLTKACLLLIVIAGMERFAFKGVASNLVTYLTDVVGLSNSSAAKMVNIWGGFTSIMPLLLAPLADSFWDRFYTIQASSFLYLLGLVALTSTALVSSWSSANKTNTSSFLFWSLCLISVGQGGYNPSLQAFGTDQLESCEEELPCSKDVDEKFNSNKKSVFFKWWYFGVCTGCLLGVTVMSYIQDTIGWVLGFAIPTLAMLTSIAFFSCGTRIYAYKETKKAEHKLMDSIVRAIKAAASRLKKGGITLPNEKSDAMELKLQEKPACHHDQSLDDKVGSFDEKPQNHIFANTRVVLRLLPIWTMLLMFAVIFQQPATFFTKQGMTMKRTIGRDFKIPPATLQSVITISIILLMPLYDLLFIPFARIITRQEKGLTVMQRMGIGMFLSIISMIFAALVETKRLEMSHKTGVLESQQSAHSSIFWLLPQYIILGIADIFAVVGMQEFFCNEVPIRMRTMGFALYTSVFGVGSFLSALLISLVEICTSSRGSHSWFSDDMREARLDKYYWLLAILSTVSLLLYAILCRYHKSRTELDVQDCT